MANKNYTGKSTDITWLLVTIFALMIAIFTVRSSQLLLSKKTAMFSRAEFSNENTIPKNTKLIIGGQIAADNEFPYFASLMHPFGLLFCGGAIIGDEWVVTAAHCMFDITQKNERMFTYERDLKDKNIYRLIADSKNIMPLEVIIGLNHFDKDMKALHYSTVDKIIFHQNYNTTSEGEGDIALLHLTHKAKGVPTISLFKPIMNELFPVYLQHLITTEKGTIPGFGNTLGHIAFPTPSGRPFFMDINPSNDLRKGDSFQIVSKNNIKEARYGLYNPFYTAVIVEDKINGTKTASGDSGSPLVFDYKGKTYLVGIHFRSDYIIEPHPTTPSLEFKQYWMINTSVGSYTSWIENKTGIKPETGTYTKGESSIQKYVQKPLYICESIKSKLDCLFRGYLCSWKDVSTTSPSNLYNSGCITNPKNYL